MNTAHQPALTYLRASLSSAELCLAQGPDSGQPLAKPQVQLLHVISCYKEDKLMILA